VNGLKSLLSASQTEAEIVCIVLFCSSFISFVWQSFSLRSRKLQKTAQKALGKARKVAAEGKSMKVASEFS